MEYCYIAPKDDELYHHGVKGMHWGIRRYQNADGSLNSDGISRYNKKINTLQKKSDKLRKKAEKYKKKSTWKLRSREGYVKYSLKSGKKSAKADKIDAKISDIKKTLLSSNKKNIEAGKKKVAKKSIYDVYPKDIDAMRKMGMDDAAIIQTTLALRNAKKKHK